MDYNTKIKHYVIRSRKQKMFTSLKEMIRNIKSVTDKELQKKSYKQYDVSSVLPR